MDRRLSSDETIQFLISRLTSTLKAVLNIRTGNDLRTTIELAHPNQEEDLTRTPPLSAEPLASVADLAIKGTTVAQMSFSTHHLRLHLNPHPCPWLHPGYVFILADHSFIGQ
jgi:hypothetical protein